MRFGELILDWGLLIQNVPKRKAELPIWDSGCTSIQFEENDLKLLGFSVDMNQYSF